MRLGVKIVCITTTLMIVFNYIYIYSKIQNKINEIK